MAPPATLIAPALIEKYNTAGPRYTSYPTVPVWRESFDDKAYGEALRQTNAPGSNPHPLSLYVHLPFCEARCLFCSCNVVITRQHEQAEKYLGFLFREIERLADRVDTTRSVVQFHWGGGTPTYLSCDQMERLFRFQTERFGLVSGAEVAIEVDPRVTTIEQLSLLKSLGFNRISMGLQDLDPVVQEAVHRIQPLAMTEAMVEQCRDLGFESLNLDLIYGLPHQTVAGFERTIHEIIRLSPDRIALYNFAYVPWMSPHQNQIPPETLPPPAVKLEIFQLALRLLTDAGYGYIGMDHFAKPEDELSVALRQGRLHRNFMGYTVQHDQAYESEMISSGVSAISALDGAFAQNHRRLADYYRAIDAERLPVFRGYALSQDDRVRRAVIKSILCQGVVDYAAIESAYAIDFEAYFAASMAKLAEPIADDLIRLGPRQFTLTPSGRILSRNIAMAFDAYLTQTPRASEKAGTFSRTV